MPRLFRIVLSCLFFGLGISFGSTAFADSSAAAEGETELIPRSWSDNSACGGGCPDSMPVCDGSKCGPCTLDAQCGSGRICDTAFGQCIPHPSSQYGGGCSVIVGGSRPTAVRSSAVQLVALFGLLSLFFFRSTGS